MDQFSNNFTEMFVGWPSTKYANISYSTEAITFMANLSSGERSRAIMALLFLFMIAV